MRYKLLKPIKIGQTITDEVTIKEDYNTGDFAKIMNGGASSGDSFLATLSVALDWPVPQVKLLSIKDGQKIFSEASNFLEIGEKSEDIVSST